MHLHGIVTVGDGRRRDPIRLRVRCYAVRLAGRLPRVDGEQYGMERLDALLAEHRELPVRTLALAVTEDCRSFAGGELSDDVAVVVIRRT